MSRRHVVAILAASLLVAPTVAAQQPAVNSRVFVNVPDIPEVEPTGSTVEQINITYRWGDGAISPDDTEVTVNASIGFGPLDPWADVSLDRDTLTYSPDAQGGQETKSVNLTINVGPGAPAAVPATVTVTANASQNGAIAPSEGNGTADLFAVASYQVQVAAPPSIDLAEAGGAIDVAVTNQGNGPVGVWIANLTAPEGIETTAPERIVLGPGDQVQANADAIDVDETVRQHLAADPTGTLSIGVTGSGSGTVAFDVAYGPAGNQTTVAGTGGTQIQVQGGGLPIVPLLVVLLVAAAIGGGYYVYREREEEREPREPILTPLDASEVEEANEGETWLEVPADEEE